MKAIFWLVLLLTTALPVSASYQFAGEDTDTASNIIYLRGRYYDPQTGSFISKDPLGLAGGINAYIYVNDNPANNADPLGLQVFDYSLPGSPLQVAEMNQAYAQSANQTLQTIKSYVVPTGVLVASAATSMVGGEVIGGLYEAGSLGTGGWDGPAQSS